MLTYITLLTWTEQGVKNVKDTTRRAHDTRAIYERHGCRARDIYWTQGACDVVMTVEAPDEQAYTAATLELASHGSVTTTTLRAFSEGEMEQILQKIASR